MAPMIDQVQVITPQGNAPLQLTRIETLEGRTADAAPGSGHRVRMLAENSNLVADGGFAMDALFAHPKTGCSDRVLAAAPVTVLACPYSASNANLEQRTLAKRFAG